MKYHVFIGRSILFSAHWCGRSQVLTKKLIEAYNNTVIKQEDFLFDIIFVCTDNDEESAEEFYKQMPWKAIPFEGNQFSLIIQNKIVSFVFKDGHRSETLLERFHIEDIPSLIILKPDGEVLTTDGVEELQMNNPIDFWINGKTLFWTREPRNESEYIWTKILCHSCQMKPLVGERFGCIDRECGYDLCDECYQRNHHEHQLIHFLSPKKNYSLEELFSDQILINTNRERLSLKSIEHKYLGLYFSAIWAEPDEDFAPQLAKVYSKASEMNLPFDIIFISADDNQMESDRHYRSMPWKALSFDDRITKLRLKVCFQVQDIPILIIIQPNGQLITKAGRKAIEQKGIEAVQTWCQGELVQYSTDDYVWTSVTCDGCGMTPLIGQRYYCSTCADYDLCAACSNEGHEHDLILIKQPDMDE